MSTIKTVAVPPLPRRGVHRTRRGVRRPPNGSGDVYVVYRDSKTDALWKRKIEECCGLVRDDENTDRVVPRFEHVSPGEAAD